MWYEELIKFLLAKIKIEEKEEASRFLTLFLRGVEPLLNKEVSDEFTFLLVDQLFSRLGGKDNDSLNFNDFARQLLGLTILYAKYYSSDDYYLDANDFIEIFGELTLDFFEEQHLVRFFNELEIEVLKEQNYNVKKIDYQNLLEILKNSNSTQLISSFLESAINHVGLDKEFDDFVEDVYQANYDDFQFEVCLLPEEINFVNLIVEFKNEIIKYKDVPEYSVTVQKLIAIHYKLNLATYAYSLNPDSTGYYNLKFAGLQILSFDYKKYPEFKDYFTNIYYAIFALGLLHPLQKGDLNPVNNGIINFLIHFERFINNFEGTNIPGVDTLLLQVKDALINYIQNQSIKGYTLFSMKCDVVIANARLVSVKDSNWYTQLNQLSFAVRGLKIVHVTELPSIIGLDCEDKFCDLLFKLTNLYEEYNAEINAEITNKMELLIAVLEITLVTYSLNKNFWNYKLFDNISEEALEIFGPDLEKVDKIAPLLEELFMTLKEIRNAPKYYVSVKKHTIFSTAKTTDNIEERYISSLNPFSRD